MLKRLKKKMGRPKIGNGCKVVAEGVEADLLKQAYAYAKRLCLGRTELFTHALRGFRFHPLKGDMKGSSP